MRSCLALIILLLFVVGCNSEYAQLSPISKTRIKVKATLPLPATADKIMIWGQHSDGSAFAKIVQSDEETTFIFNNGGYNLYAIAWSGAGLTGTVYCNSFNTNLAGPDQTINLQLSNTDCSSPIFKGASATTVPESLGTVSAEWCDTVRDINSASDKCTDDLTSGVRKQARGHAMSYRFVVRTYDKSRSSITFKSDSIYSNCMTGSPSVFTPLDGLASGLSGQLPVGDGTSTPFYLTLETFPGSTICDDSTHGKISVPFQNGLKQSSSTSKYFLDGTDHKVFVRMSGSDICNSTTTSQTFAGGDGSQKSPYMICNPTQFYNTHTTRTSSFKLLNDIDLTGYYYGITTLPNIPNGLSCLEKGSNFIPLGYDFGTCLYSGESFPTGDFDGGGKTIKGLRMFMSGSSLVGGLYTRKYGGEIRRLKLDQVMIKAMSFVGSIVGQTQASIRDIAIDRTTLESTNSTIGGIAGSNTVHPNNCTFKNILVNRTNVTGYLGSVGGIIGESNSCEFNTISFSGNVSSTVSTNVGGLSGYLYNSVVDQVSIEGYVKGFSYVGGITGDFLNTTLSNSKVVGSVFATHTGGGVNAGGLIGHTNGVANAASSFVKDSYFYGQITNFCQIATLTDCGVGNIVGDPGGWGPGDFLSDYYLSSNSTNGKSAFNTGTGKSYGYFYNTGSTFPAAFILTGDLPRLSHEINAGTMDMRHSCQRNLGYDSIANQIAAGKGSSSDNPIGICNSNQLTDMQSNAINPTKFYKLLSPILMSFGTSVSSYDFTGQLDGDFKQIIRLDLAGAMGLHAGWWKSIGANAVMKNLYFIDSKITDAGPSATTALIAQVNRGIIDSVYAVATISNPLDAGEHSLFVHTNSGTIKNSFVGGSSTVKNQMAGLAFENTGTIEDSEFKSTFTCTFGQDCFSIAGISFNNTGTIRRNVVTSVIQDVSGSAGASDFSFLALNNSGTLEDIQITSTSKIVSYKNTVHAISKENTGTIRRIFNDGYVQVASYTLPPVLAYGSMTASDFQIGATSTVGFNNSGNVSNIAFTKRARWSYPVQYASVARSAGIGSCSLLLDQDLPAIWENNMVDASYFSRFSLMVSTTDEDYYFISPPTLAASPASDTFITNDPFVPCSMTAGNPVVWYAPLDYSNGSQRITPAQKLSFATFSTWAGTNDMTTDDSIFHQARLNGYLGIVDSNKPVWIFDTTNSIRLNR